MKFILAILILAAVIGTYLYFNPEVADQWLEETKETLKDAPVFGKPDTTVLYKWKNEQAQWQVSDQLPPPGTPYEILEYRRDVNILPLPPELQAEE